MSPTSHAPAPPRVAARSQRWLAGGVDSPVRAGLPVGAPTPALIEGHGARVRDEHGREYVDYICGYGPVLLGHGDKRVARAIAKAATAGTVFGATHPEEVRLAQRLVGAFPSMESVRFVSTGTEACMSAARLARAFTRREKIVRFEGCYHGHSDDMIFSAGASSLSAATIASGVSGGVIHEVLVLPYNDIFAVDRTLRARRNEVAAIIVEPVAANMGLCLPVPGFLEGLRDLCRAFGAVLIFDEVITGLRVGPGGAQASLNVRPDLTCLGKALGGGLPIAAFGGRGDIMAKLAPDGPVFQGGTFSGNPLCVAAAHALLDAIEAEDGFYGRLDARATRLATGLRAAAAAAGCGVPVVQYSSMVDLRFRLGPPHVNMREAMQADPRAYSTYYHAMLERGVLLPPSQMELMFVTASHGEDDIEATLAAAGAALKAACRAQDYRRSAGGPVHEQPG